VGSVDRSVWHGQSGRFPALAVSRLKEPGMHPDGGGLYLQISKAGARFSALMPPAWTPTDRWCRRARGRQGAAWKPRGCVTTGRVPAGLDSPCARRPTRSVVGTEKPAARFRDRHSHNQAPPQLVANLETSLGATWPRRSESECFSSPAIPRFAANAAMAQYGSESEPGETSGR
jgi:hypothetical protein